jgi:hypothetical protein
MTNHTLKPVEPNNYGAAFNPNLPQISNMGSQNLTATSADLVGQLTTNGASAAWVYLFCATNDWTTNEASWIANGTATNFGPFTSGATFTSTLSGLSSNTTYYWNHMASNASGKAWAVTAGSPSFKTYGQPSVNNTTGATSVGASTATLNGTLTDGASANVFIYWWLNGAGATNVIDFGAPRTEGSFSTDLSGLTPGMTYFYRCFASNAYGTAWAPTASNFTTAGHSYYVARSGNGGDGLSWATAFTNVQAALNTAQSNDTIYIKGETFILPANSANGLLVWTQSFVNVYGGYASDGGMPGALTNTPTVLANTNAASVTSNRVLYISGVTNAVLSRVTIAGGRIASGNGAGLAMVNCTNLTLDASTISSNVNSGASGGGLFVSASGVVLTNCTVAGNSVSANTQYGGGIYLASGVLGVRDTVIARNVAQGAGGGIVVAAGVLRMRDCLLNNNAANMNNTPLRAGGGMVLEGSGTVVLENCTVADNIPEGINFYSGTALALTNCVLRGNGLDLTGNSAANSKVAYCAIGTTNTFWTNGVNGCTSADPLFEFGYYLGAGSPCVNAGTNNASDYGLDGRTTRTDGTADTGRVDMGYHYAGGFDTSYADIYVSASAGNDGSASSGTNSATPLKTIGKAISLARDGSRIHIAAGQYTNGVEAFPLVLGDKTGVQLLGTNAALTVISGSGIATNVPLMKLMGLSGARIEGLTFTAANISSGWTTGSGLYIYDCGSLTLASCIISGNTNAASGTYGGGLYILSCATTITNCTVARNKAAFGGGGLYINYGDTTVLDTVVTLNQIANYWGGGVAFGGANTLTVRMRNCLIQGNVTPGNAGRAGAGVYLTGGQAVLANCTVAENSTEGVVPFGGSVTLTNCIAWGNADDLRYSCSVSYCDIETADTFWTNGVNGCISADPLFRNGYYLATNSPCVDAGTNNASAYGLDSRTTRTDGTPDSGRVDMGYHYEAVALALGESYPDLYVSATDGNDSSASSGTNAATPLKTIGKALSLAQDGTRVHIAAGQYTNGVESFPLTLSGKSGVQLLGTNAALTVISGGGIATNAPLLKLTGLGGSSRIEGLTFANCRITSTWTTGAGIYIDGCSGLTIGSCTIANNTNTLNASMGGGLYLLNSMVTLTNCLVARNAVGSNGSGGGIESASSTLTVLDTVIEQNQVGSGGLGGGICHQGGITTLIMRNCLVSRNTAPVTAGRAGAGIYLHDTGGKAVLESCTIATNTVEGVTPFGGTATLTNCIVWGNGGTNLYNDATRFTGIGYCAIGTTNTFWTNGVNGCILLTDSPFVNAATNNFQLRSGSPCIDAGMNMSWMTNAFDLGGAQRIQNKVVDIGAYERPSALGTTFRFR